MKKLNEKFNEKIKQLTDEFEAKNNELTRENGELKIKISEIPHEKNQFKKHLEK